eukprot:6488836-Amphidinium_carterae.1
MEGRTDCVVPLASEKRTSRRVRKVTRNSRSYHGRSNRSCRWPSWVPDLLRAAEERVPDFGELAVQHLA